MNRRAFLAGTAATATAVTLKAASAARSFAVSASRFWVAVLSRASISSMATRRPASALCAVVGNRPRNDREAREFLWLDLGQRCVRALAHALVSSVAS